MQSTMVTESKPLIEVEEVHAKTKTAQCSSTKENERFLTIDDLVEYKQKNLMKKILITVIIVNLLVLFSIIVLT